jgi:hypothetical protein
MRLIEITPITTALLTSSSATESSPVYSSGEPVRSEEMRVSTDGKRIYSATTAFDAQAFQITTVTVATPGVFTKVAHGLSANQPIKFYTSTGLTTWSSITVGTQYYVKTVLSADTFTISTAAGGTALAMAGSGLDDLYLYYAQAAGQPAVTNTTYWTDAGPDPTLGPCSTRARPRRRRTPTR